MEIKGEWSLYYIFENGCITISRQNHGINNTGTPIENIEHYDFILDVFVVSQKLEFTNSCEFVSVNNVIKILWI